jgi:hypothetical protein
MAAGRPDLRLRAKDSVTRYETLSTPDAEHSV